MNSKPELAKWLDRHRELVRQIDPDPADARAKLLLAGRNLERAQTHGVADPDFALVAAESALVNIADAVLARHGFRLRGKTGSHEARFSFLGLPNGFRAHSAVIAAARKSRNIAMYDTAGGVSASFVREVTGIVSELLKEARRR